MLQFVENELEAELYKLIMSRAVTTVLEKVRNELLTSRSPVPSKTSLKLLIECALSVSIDAVMFTIYVFLCFFFHS